MSDTTLIAGAILAMAGGVLLTMEVVHPGAFLLIPGSALLAGGILYIVIPDFLTSTPFGPLLIAIVAVLATLATVPLYKHWGKVHVPMTSMPDSLAGKEGFVVSPVIPNTMKGKVRVGSEVWSARADAPIPAGVMVRIIGGSGVSLQVTRIPDEKSSKQ